MSQTREWTQVSPDRWSLRDEGQDEAARVTREPDGRWLVTMHLRHKGEVVVPRERHTGLFDDLEVAKAEAGKYLDEQAEALARIPAVFNFAPIGKVKFFAPGEPPEDA